MRFGRRHLRTFAGLATAGVISAIALVVFGSAAARALPAPFNAVQSELSSRFRIEVTALSAETATSVTESDAESDALSEFGVASTQRGVVATLVSATDSSFAQTQSDGRSVPVLSNRPVWLVLIPDVQVPITCPPGRQCASSYTATQAVLIDAHTGAFLEAAAIPTG